MAFKKPMILLTEKKGKRKIQAVPHLQATAHPRHEKEEETDKTKQAQIEQTYKKHCFLKTLDTIESKV